MVRQPDGVAVSDAVTISDYRVQGGLSLTTNELFHIVAPPCIKCTYDLKYALSVHIDWTLDSRFNEIEYSI